MGLPPTAAAALRAALAAFLASQLPTELAAHARLAEGHLEASAGMTAAGLLPAAPPAGQWGIAPFFVPTRLDPNDPEAAGPRRGAGAFALRAPTTARNAFRLLRAMQLRKAVLLEGSPGVGKTSLVAALAKSVGQTLVGAGCERFRLWALPAALGTWARCRHDVAMPLSFLPPTSVPAPRSPTYRTSKPQSLHAHTPCKPQVRINLSEQTDMMDLLGADLPAPGGAPGQFAWVDGPLLGALRAGHWVLLDELNLAGQSVLEGLNALLDHRWGSAVVCVVGVGRGRGGGSGEGCCRRMGGAGVVALW